MIHHPFPLIGMPTLIELSRLEDNIALCRQLGLNLIEINLNLPSYQLDELEKLTLPDDLTFSFHLPEELNPWDFNELVREAYLDYLDKVIKIALEKNIILLNMHMNGGIHFTLPDRKVYLFEKYRDHYRKCNEAFLLFLDQHIQSTGLKICIENTGLYGRTYITEAVEELLLSPAVSLTWDIGHDHSAGGIDRSFIKEHLERLSHVHLHDGRNKNNHLPLGSGEIDLKEIISLISGVSPSVILETKTANGLKDSVNYLFHI